MKYKEWTRKEESGWMPFYYGRPYWPLFKTRKEAREYARWKANWPKNPNMKIARCSVRVITLVKHNCVDVLPRKKK